MANYIEYSDGSKVAYIAKVASNVFLNGKE